MKLVGCLAKCFDTWGPGADPSSNEHSEGKIGVVGTSHCGFWLFLLRDERHLVLLLPHPRSEVGGASLTSQ